MILRGRVAGAVEDLGALACALPTGLRAFVGAELTCFNASSVARMAELNTADNMPVAVAALGFRRRVLNGELRRFDTQGILSAKDVFSASHAPVLPTSRKTELPLQCSYAGTQPAGLVVVCQWQKSDRTLRMYWPAAE